MKNLKYLVIISILFFTTCGATTKNNYDVKSYDKNNINQYERYLVSETDYTTGAVAYHKKYKESLYSLVEMFLNTKKFEIVDKSLGFYYDQKKGTNHYYLGFDMICNSENVLSDQSYEINGRRMIKIYYKSILEVMNSYEKIFDEEEIDGVVIGLVWKRNGRNETLNIWTSKNDIKDLFDNKRTFRELVIRSTVTDGQDRIIRLTI